MPLPGERVAALAKDDQGKYQLPFLVQRHRGHWCNTETGEIVRHPVVYWRSPDREDAPQVNTAILPSINAQEARRSRTSDDDVGSVRISSENLEKLAKLKRDLSPPPAEPLPAPVLMPPSSATAERIVRRTRVVQVEHRAPRRIAAPLARAQRQGVPMTEAVVIRTGPRLRTMR